MCVNNPSYFTADSPKNCHGRSRSRRLFIDDAPHEARTAAFPCLLNEGGALDEARPHVARAKVAHRHRLDRKLAGERLGRRAVSKGRGAPHALMLSVILRLLAEMVVKLFAMTVARARVLTGLAGGARAGWGACSSAGRNAHSVRRECMVVLPQ